MVITAHLLPLHVPVTARKFSLRATLSSSNGVPSGAPKSGGPIILEIPLDKIRRPLSRTRANDPDKVNDLMESIREIGLQEPVSPVVTVLRHTNALASLLYVAKSEKGQRKLSGITCADLNYN